MKLQLPAILLLGLAVTAYALGQQQQVVTVTAEAIGAEFEKDTDAAVKKYLPPKAGGGVHITMTGVVTQVDAKNREVALQAGANSRVILHAKNVAGIKPGDKVMVEKATFRNYARRSILIDCDEVRLAK